MTPPSRILAAARTATEQAVAEAQLAYEFGPNAYSYSCLHACLAAEQAVAVLRGAILEQQFFGEGE
jgi:hypothetical protein